MNIREKIIESISQVKVESGNDLTFNINFLLDPDGDRQEFFISLNEGVLRLQDGLYESPHVHFECRVQTLQSMLDLGIDPFSAISGLTIPAASEDFSMPDIDPGVYLESATLEGLPLRFNMFVEEQILYVVEGEDMDSDISIRIKPAILPELIRGNMNVPMALLTGKIKIKNKRELFQLLARFGLKI